MVKIIECFAGGRPSSLGIDLIRYHISVHYEEGGIVRGSIFRERYPVIGQTEKTYLIDCYGQWKRVLKSQDGKRFAYLTDDAAIRSLQSRVKWRKVHANTALVFAEHAQSLFDEMMKDKEDDRNTSV